MEISQNWNSFSYHPFYHDNFRIYHPDIGLPPLWKPPYPVSVQYGDEHPPEIDRTLAPRWRSPAFLHAKRAMF